MKKNDILLLFLLIIIIAFSQIIGKYGVSVCNNSIYGVLFNGFVLLSYLLLLTRGIIWIKLLQTFNISYLYPLLSFSFILIPMLSFIIFNETYSLGKIIGSSFIFIGIYFCSHNSMDELKKI